MATSSKVPRMYSDAAASVVSTSARSAQLYKTTRDVLGPHSEFIHAPASTAVPVYEVRIAGDTVCIKS
jgi:hypothetical protein